MNGKHVEPMYMNDVRAAAWEILNSLKEEIQNEVEGFGPEADTRVRRMVILATAKFLHRSSINPGPTSDEDEEWFKAEDFITHKVMNVIFEGAANNYPSQEA